MVIQFELDLKNAWDLESDYKSIKTALRRHNLLKGFLYRGVYLDQIGDIVKRGTDYPDLHTIFLSTLSECLGGNEWEDKDYESAFLYAIERGCLAVYKENQLDQKGMLPYLYRFKGHPTEALHAVGIIKNFRP